MRNSKAVPHSWGLKARKSTFLKARKRVLWKVIVERSTMCSLLKAVVLTGGRSNGCDNSPQPKQTLAGWGFLLWPAHKLCLWSLLACFPPKSIPLQALWVFEKLQAYYTSHIAFTTHFPTKLENKNKFSHSTTHDWYTVFEIEASHVYKLF